MRQKDAYDGAVPSGNSVAMLNLLKIARMTGDPEPENTADRLARALSGRIAQFPAGYTQFLCGLTLALGPSHEVVLAGPSQSGDMQAMIGALRSRFIPEKVVLVKREGKDVEGPAIEEMAPFVKPYGSGRETALAYVCTGGACALPTSSPSEMLRLLGETDKGRSG